MKRVLIILLVAMLVTAVVSPVTVKAQSATAEAWTSSITYYTPSAAGGDLYITYYDGVSSYPAGPFEMNGHAAGSVNMSSTSAPTGFVGSAVLSATVPIIATHVQFSSASPNSYSRAFYTGFDATKANSTFYLATVRANGIATTRIAVQNIEESTITATLKFYAVGATTPTFQRVVDIKKYETYTAAINTIPGYPGGSFDGSMVVTATGRVVATALETLDTGRGVIAYEGSASGAATVYMASAMCNRGVSKQTSFYAVQNTGASTANVVVDYYNTAGVKVGSMPQTQIAQGAKLSTNPCQQNLLVNELGSAVIRSTNAVPLIAIGKVSTSDGLLTAFVGETAGSTKVAAPYIRWGTNSATQYNASIAVMNVGGAPATNVVARYFDSTGALRATVPLSSGASPLNPFTKVNTNPSTAGALVGGVFGYTPNGGAVEISSDQPVIATIRLYVQPVGIPGVSIFGEDYNAVPIP